MGLLKMKVDSGEFYFIFFIEDTFTKILISPFQTQVKIGRGISSMRA